MSLRNTKWILMLLTILSLSSCGQDGQATNGAEKNPEGLGLSAASVTELSSLQNNCLKKINPELIVPSDKRKSAHKKLHDGLLSMRFSDLKVASTEIVERIGQFIITRVGLELKPLRAKLNRTNCDQSQLLVSLYPQEQ